MNRENFYSGGFDILCWLVVTLSVGHSNASCSVQSPEKRQLLTVATNPKKEAEKRSCEIGQLMASNRN